MSGVTTNCKGCGSEIPENMKGGGKRLWCSEGCRKRHSYCGTCERCGGRTGYSGVGSKPSAVCDACCRAEIHERSVAWMVAEIHHWYGLYGEVPAAAHWNLPFMRNRSAPATLAEIERRHQEDGPWPVLNNVHVVFGGWNVFVEAAGFRSVGVGKRRRVAA